MTRHVRIIWTLLVLAQVVAACSRGHQVPAQREGGGHGDQGQATFEMWLGQSHAALLGTLGAVNHKQFFIDEPGAVAVRQLTLRIDEVVSADPAYGATFTVGGNATILQSVGQSFPAWLVDADVGAQFLVLGWVLFGARTKDSPPRVFDVAMTIFPQGTYQKVHIQGRGDWAVRLEAPRYSKAVYEGTRSEIVNTLVTGRVPRPVNALPWVDLMGRARNPERDIDRHLGYEEIRVSSHPSPDSSGVTPQDEPS